MKQTLINEALPALALSKLGLQEGKNFILNVDDLTALLSGRRTSLVKLQHLIGEDFTIESVEAKLSMDMEEDSDQAIIFHPVYKEPQLVADLSLEETQQLIRGELQNIVKNVKLSDGEDRRTVFEYDKETRDFVSYEASKVQVPYKVNGEIMNLDQKREFANGNVVELSEGTLVQYRATEPQGIIANRPALFVSYFEQNEGFIIENIPPLKDTDIQHSPFTKGFEKVFFELQKSLPGGIKGDFLQREFADLKSEYSRGYGQGTSR